MVARTKKPSKLFKFDKYLILLGIISILFLASVVRYTLRTFKIPEWDEQHYMRMATEFYRLLQNPTADTINQMLSVVPFRQIGYPLLILPFLMIFGLSNSYFWGIFTNGLLYIATIFGIYFLTRQYLSSLSSFLASIIFAFYGWTLWHVHLTYSETAVSAFAVWTIFFLIKSDLFRNKKYSILFGIFLGLGLLVKWIVLVYVAGPLLYIFYRILKDHLFKNKKVLIYGTAAFLIAFVISFYPYFHNSYWISQYFYGHRVGGPMWLIVAPEERNPLSLYSLTFYLNSFSQLGIFFI
ncbi:MAG: glycosyltransferase family 39 protein, partial [Candidatus Levybacteria bacterium]|nr:glycosyltransferase family 39 protein [Candidatus Levybacteria bacterium]